ncbi:hypothetical protein K435DRAFT_683283 [Dendrothele bispora CBS 962.96]|uniref:DDE-1 domain-containing protein n=1 Tax=Dendrothele bispora (strain CBS 962.96) TaxID=1314807 RepID=A0A4S8LCZ6_DENBC|nr:hypothetical protein K435DRAFT_683283 [Dendrothele bispora CBS 962.96]
MKPELLQKCFNDGSKFRASESFVRAWLHDALAWSPRKGTRASHKTPENWKELCDRAALRKAYIIKEHDIPPELYVNSDQTQFLYAPGDKMTWADTGAKQVELQGEDEKRAFTLMVSVSADGALLPFQAIYVGGTDRSCPAMSSPGYEEAMELGFIFEPSETKTYWSNQQRMRSFVDKILVPYYDKCKIALGLPLSQHSLWEIDVWAVHRSREFRDWMREKHPTIKFTYVPPGCTGVGQACDVGIQRPLKLSAKKSYHEDVVKEVMDHLKGGNCTYVPEKRVSVLRDRSVRWLVTAHRSLNRKELVKR